MKRFAHRGVGVVLASVACVSALALWTSAAAKEPAKFPVARVTMYDAGVAQFEREAQVQGADQLSIPVNLAHLDDFLASLIVATDGNVRVRAVRYPTAFNMGQARAASSFAANMAGRDNGDEEVDSETYVDALIGTAVTVETRAGKGITGTVIDCLPGVPAPPADPKTPEAAAPKGEPPKVVLVGQEGSLLWIPLPDIAKIAPVSAREQEGMAAYARQLGKANGLDETQVTIEVTDDSKGRLAAGYVRQVPVWRTMYKIMAREKDVMLEAWAIVHNDTDEDWERVHLTLVSGFPDSYVMSVASPRYAERSSLDTQGDLSMIPQLGAATPDTLLYEENVSVSYGYVGASAAAYGSGSGMGMASGRSSLSARGGVSMASEQDSSLLQVGVSAAEETAEPAVEKEISTYTALDRVSVSSRSSGMVPLIKRTVPGFAFTQIEGSGTGMTCVRLDNQTGLVLQAGVASFYINGRFRGQAEMVRDEPGEIRVLCIGEDADVEATVTTESTKTVKAVEWKNDRLWAHELKTVTQEYTISNRAGLERRVGLPVHHRKNGRLLSPEKSVEGEAMERLVMLDVAGRSEATQKLQIEEGVMTERSVGAAVLRKLLEATALQADQRTVLEAALVPLAKAEALVAKQQELSKAAAKQQAAIDRRKESLAAVPQGAGTTKTAEALLKELAEAGRELERLQAENEKLEAQFADLNKEAVERLKTLPKPSIP
jgi:hypothetical protein